MAIHYVDTYNGSDSNDGSSWAQAWRSCYPIKALYGSLGTVSNLEIRIAKTAPVEQGIRVYATTGYNNRPIDGYMKPAIASSYTAQASVYVWGGTAIAPFVGGADEGTASPYRPEGTYKFRVDAPPGTSGLAARWSLADGDFSSFQCFEAVAAFYFAASDDACLAEAWLEFATDINGTNIIWSRKLEAGTRKYEARLCLLGNGDLPDGAAYVFLRINNPTSSLVHLDCSGVSAVLPTTHPQYVGLRMLYLPNDRMGLPLAPSMFWKQGSVTYPILATQDGPGIDSFRESISEPPRTWDIYVWEPFPYAPEALLPTCATAGSSSVPLKVSGGWNTATNTIDGVSAIDAANLRWFNGVRKVSIDVRNVALTFRRTGKFSQQGTPGIMEYAGYGYNKQLLGCYAEYVYISGAGPGCVGEKLNSSASDDVRESLVSVPNFGLSVGSKAAFRHCSTNISVPFGGGVDFDFVEDSTWSQDRIRQRVEKVFRVNRCVLVSPRPSLDPFNPDVGEYAKAPTYDDCDIIATSVSNVFGNNYASAPMGWLENCRLWGPYTGPTGVGYPAKNLQFNPLPVLPGPICISGADIDGLSITASDLEYHTTEPMFARTGYMADSVKVKLKNANVQMIFSSFVPASSTLDYVGHTVELENVTLHKTSASQGAPFKSSRLRANGLTMSGAWTAVQEGIVRMTDIDRLIFTDANTKIVDNFRFSAPAAGWGRVCATYRNIVHPLGLSGFLGTPSSGYNAAGAAWFHAADGEMWASSVMTVMRDKAVAHSGLSSWKLSALQPIGAISRGSFMVGVVPVTAGVEVTFTANIRRSSTDALGGLFIRPAATRQFSDPTTVNAPSLHDIVTMQNPDLPPNQWEQVTVTYTPYRSGLVELHAGRRGMPGSYVWLDSLKVTQ